MRTFISWRFWLTMVAMAGLVFGALHVTRGQRASAEPADVAGRPDERAIDLIGPVFLTQADPGAAIVDGATSARIQIRVDGFRYMNIAPGTPGENRCREATELATCVVAADLLGEAVLWFALLPAEPRNEVTLPPVVELRDGGTALLANGWVVRRAETVLRDCPDDDVPSLTEFVREHSEGSTTTFDIERQEIVEVTCAGAEHLEPPALPSGPRRQVS